LQRCVAVCAALVLSACFAPSAAEKENIVRLNKYNFHDNVKRGKWFVKFYAPWCTHCQRMAPIWEKLADQAVSREWPVKIAEVDCTSSGDICDKAKIKGFPTLVLISEGKLQSKYQGEASMQHFESWLSDQQVLQAGASATESSGNTVLAEDSAEPTQSSATHGKALTALVMNLLTRFPTQSKIVNLYFYGGVVIVLVVVFLVLVVRATQDEEPKED